MPDAPLGVARYPGIASITQATLTLGHGITPAACDVTFAPQPFPPARRGTLEFWYAGERVVSIPGCSVDRASIQRDGSGYVVAASIIDRRRKWKFGEIYGQYNLRDKDRNLLSDTRKSPAQLAQLLLDAMGETATDLGAVPDEFSGPVPKIDWDGDVPAEELAELLEDWNCRIALDPYGSGRVGIFRYGQGAAPPPGAILRRSGDIDPPEAPDSIRVNFDETVVGARLPLEAVGRDTDGSLKPIDQLSYRPAGGWEKEGDAFSNVTGETARVYCLQSVFRWYRIKLPDGGLVVPNVGTLTSVKHLLPLLDEQVETWVDPDDLAKKPKPVKVYGTYYIRNSGVPKNSSKTDNWECKTRFRVLGELGVIAFDEPVTKFDESTASDPAAYRFRPAELYADVAFTPKSPETRAYHRYSYLVQTGQNDGTGPEVISAKDEGGLKVYQKRSSPTDDSFEWAYLENASPSALDSEGRKYADAALEKWAVAAGETLTYAGIVPVPLDGLNVQVTWSVGLEGHTTELARSRESSPFVPKYEARRRDEKARRLVSRERRRADRGTRHNADGTFRGGIFGNGGGAR